MQTPGGLQGMWQDAPCTNVNDHGAVCKMGKREFIGGSSIADPGLGEGAMAPPRPCENKS